MAQFTREELLAERERRRALRTQGEQKVAADQPQAQVAQAEEAPATTDPAATGGKNDEAQKAALARASETGALGKIRSAIAGAVQGATFGFGDELAGLQNVTLGTLLTEPSKIPDEYRQGRDRVREVNAAAQGANPKTYIGGEIGGGLASALVPGAAPATLGKAVLAGAGAGAASGLGSSEADLTKGEIGGAAVDAAQGLALGGVGGAVATAAGKGLASGANKLWRGAHKGAEKLGLADKTPPLADQKAVRKVAQQAAGRADELEGATQSGTRKSFYEKSMEIQDDSNRRLEAMGITDKLRFRPGQALADPELAQAEREAINFKRTMSKAQKEKAIQRQLGAKTLDSYVNDVAAKPELLGKSLVGKNIDTVLDNHIAGMVSARSEVTRPLYEAAEKAGGGSRIMPTDYTRGAMGDVIEIFRMAPPGITSQVKSSIDVIEEAMSKSGRIKLRDMQSLRETWGLVARGKLNIIDGLDTSKQRFIGRNILKAIDMDLDAAEQGIKSADAVKLLREANALWRTHSQAIDDTATETVTRLLRVNADAGDTIVKKLESASEDEIRGVFRILNKADPELAELTRAQMLDDAFTKAGKPIRGDTEDSARFFSPQTAYSLLADPKRGVRQRLLAAYEGSPKAQMALQKSIHLLERLAFGPGTEGSTTAPQLAHALGEITTNAAATGAGAAVGGIPGTALASIGKVVMRALGNDKDLNRVYSSPENIDTFNKAMQSLLSRKAPNRAGLNAIVALGDVIGLQMGDTEQTQEGHQP